MQDQLLISDANILIDMDVAGLLDRMFALPFEFMTPDSLFEEELRDFHESLIEKGLRLESLAPELIERVGYLSKSHKGVSNHDLTALVLAEEKETPLLTGDRKLRQVCKDEGVVVYGTLWLINELFLAGLITVEDAEIA
jgi:predicted nucleic acid-binding protein